MLAFGHVHDIQGCYSHNRYSNMTVGTDAWCSCKLALKLFGTSM
jgi:hypothetical protein